MLRSSLSVRTYPVYIHERDYSSKDLMMMMIAAMVEMRRRDQLSVIGVKHDSSGHFADEVEQQWYAVAVY